MTPAEQALRDAALDYHRSPSKGKITVNATKPLSNQRDLSLAYSPGVAAACEEIVADPANAFPKLDDSRATLAFRSRICAAVNPPFFPFALYCFSAVTARWYSSVGSLVIGSTPNAMIYTGPTAPTAEAQIEVINSLISQKVDALAISANDRDALVPIADGRYMASQIKGEPFGTDYTGPAGLRMLGDITRLSKQAGQGEADDGLRKAIINVAGDLLRLPSAQINRSITGAKALEEGKITPAASA